MSTRHRNAGGPFTIFDPGLGVSGSLSLNGEIAGTNVGLQVNSPVFVSGSLSAGSNLYLSLSDNEIDVSSGDLTLDVAGNVEINADGGTITFKDGGATLGTITSAGFSGAATQVTATDNESTVENNLVTFVANAATNTGAHGLEMDGDFHYNPGTGTLTATSFSGAFSGTAAIATNVTITAGDSDDEENYIVYAPDESGSGNLGLESDADLKFNPSTGTITSKKLSLKYDGSHNTLIETQSDGDLRIQNTGANVYIEPTGDGYLQVNDNGTDGYVKIGGQGKASMYRFSDSYSSTLSFYRSTGNSSSITGVSSGNVLGSLRFFGYYESAGANDGARIEITARETWTDEANGSSMDFQTCANGSDGLVSRIYINGASGHVGINDNAPGHTLDVNGDINLTGGLSFDDGTAVTEIDATATLGTSDSKLATQKAIKAYVDNELAGVSTTNVSSAGSNRVITSNSGQALVGEANLIFNGTTLSIGDPGSTATTILDVGGYNNSSPGAGSSSAKPVIGIKQVVNNDSGHAAIGITTSDGSYGFYMGVDTGGNLDIRSNAQGSGTHPVVHNGVQIPRSQSSETQIVTSVIAFTGYHRNIPADDSLQDYKNNHIGKIVVSDGTYQNLETDSVISKPLISQALPKIRLASKRNEKSCFGVVASIEEDDKRYYGYGGQIQSYMDLSDEDRRVIVNSLGEGGIWVCNINGNLENGDYITTCEVPGLGMKQDTEMLCNYTVAKITQDCNFRINAANYDVEEFEFEGKTYRKAFVGCTYHCG